MGHPTKITKKSIRNDVLRITIGLLALAVIMRFVGVWEDHSIAWYVAGAIGLVFFIKKAIQYHRVDKLKDYSGDDSN